MEYQTFYRKYRPITFSMVFGQDAIVKTLKNIIKKERLNHAYLFTGPRGTGKTSCAKLFAKTVNCLNNNSGDACNKCENCLSYIKNSNPDIIEIDAASNNGVDEIRELKSKINLVPSMSKYKVYIIDEVHMLSIGAFNALLKTLEEPPEYVIFILATTEPQKIPSTIISRCQRFDFKRINQKSMENCLNNIIKKEKINIESDALEEIISNANGGMRDAIGLLDQAQSYCDDIITKKEIETLSGSVSDLEIINIINEMLNENYEYIFKKSEEWENDGKDFVLIIQKILNLIKNGILYKKKILDVAEKTNEIYNKISDIKLYEMFDKLNEIYLKIEKTTQKKDMFEINFIYLIRFLAEKTNSNVSRETLEKEKKDVSRETLEKNSLTTNETTNFKIQQLKNARINNIILFSSKEILEKVKTKWKKIEKYLTNSKYKLCAGILINSNVVTACEKGIIITVDENINVKRLENEYNKCIELIKLIMENEYKLVFITSEQWLKIRPEYIKKYKNNDLKEIEEEKILNETKINDNNVINEFAELIEME